MNVKNAFVKGSVLLLAFCTGMGITACQKKADAAKANAAASREISPVEAFLNRISDNYTSEQKETAKDKTITGTVRFTSDAFQMETDDPSIAFVKVVKQLPAADADESAADAVYTKFSKPSADADAVAETLTPKEAQSLRRSLDMVAILKANLNVKTLVFDEAAHGYTAKVNGIDTSFTLADDALTFVSDNQTVRVTCVIRDVGTTVIE